MTGMNCSTCGIPIELPLPLADPEAPIICNYCSWKADLLIKERQERQLRDVAAVPSPWTGL